MNLASVSIVTLLAADAARSRWVSPTVSTSIQQHCLHPFAASPATSAPTSRTPRRRTTTGSCSRNDQTMRGGLKNRSTIRRIDRRTISGWTRISSSSALRRVSQRVRDVRLVPRDRRAGEHHRPQGRRARAHVRRVPDYVLREGQVARAARDVLPGARRRRRAGTSSRLEGHITATSSSIKSTA